MNRQDTEEQKRLLDNDQTPVPQWYKWGPYVAERSWGTVREDYSSDGDAWSFFPFDDSHKKAYRWGEDGIAGWCDRYQILAFTPAFWNGKDPILKERLFGLTSQEGNHGEDVKECYYYLDATPTHSYMRYLYKYPQGEFPYEELRRVNGERNLNDTEYEITDTEAFKNGKYFDIYIEYAKDSSEDLYVKIEAFNRGDQPAPLHIIPQLIFRNRWSWNDNAVTKPQIKKSTLSKYPCLLADDTQQPSPSNLFFNYHLGERYLYGMEGGKPLFTNNESVGEQSAHTKDAFHEAIVHGKNATNPEEWGTKACLHYYFEAIDPGQSQTLYLKLCQTPQEDPIANIESVITQRRKEADQFYDALRPTKASDEEAMIQRAALAGMIWTKQIYLFDVNVWQKGDKEHITPDEVERDNIRNTHWGHLNSMRIFSMPDKWEYPWFAAWDTAFHSLTLALIDIEFAKEQVWLLLFDQFQHPNGAIPAYEWEFSDLNPPVQAWAAFRLYQMQKEQTGVEDRSFLEKCFLKLLLNFAFWVNKVDSSGCNVFEGGFLGLDNISLIDRSIDVAKQGTLKQSDGTGWMAMFCLNLMRIAMELAKTNSSYESMATKFFQHFVYIADATKNLGHKQYSMWSEDEGFFYDVLVQKDGTFSKFHVRSLVGLIPLYAVEVISDEELSHFPEMKRDFEWFLNNRKSLTKDCITPIIKDNKKLYVLSLANEHSLEKLLKYVWDPEEFRSDYGLRSISKFHEKHPFTYKKMQVGYEPGEAVNLIKGGNSNWRGPLWFPTTYLFILSLSKFAEIFGQTLQVNVKNEPSVLLNEIPYGFANRMISLFTQDETGVRPFLGKEFPFALDPHFKDHILFYEFYHGDTGKGLGASHQTGWSGLVANLIEEYRQ